MCRAQGSRRPLPASPPLRGRSLRLLDTHQRATDIANCRRIGARISGGFTPPLLLWGAEPRAAGVFMTGLQISGWFGLFLHRTAMLELRQLRLHLRPVGDWDLSAWWVHRRVQSGASSLF